MKDNLAYSLIEQQSNELDKFVGQLRKEISDTELRLSVLQARLTKTTENRTQLEESKQMLTEAIVAQALKQELEVLNVKSTTSEG